MWEEEGSNSMDPITAALAAGAAAGLADTVSQAVRDAYGALRTALAARYPDVDARPLERLPGSGPKQESLSEDVVAAGAHEDAELLRLARALIDAVEREAPQAAAGVGVDLERVRAEFVEIERVTGGGTGVRMREVEATGGITVRDVRGGGGPDPNP